GRRILLPRRAAGLDQSPPGSDFGRATSIGSIAVFIGRAVTGRVVPHVRKFLGQRLRELRKSRKYSQTRLAERSGLSGKFIGEVERGEKSISIDSLYRVSVALAVPLATLTDVGRSQGSVPIPDAEKIVALVLSGRRRGDIRRAYQVLERVLA